jgi:hypothetical protein
MLLPHAAHLVCNDLFLGVSLLTTVLVALYLHDEALKIDQGQNAQPIDGVSPPPPLLPTWVAHRRKLVAGSVFLTLSAATPLSFIFVPSFWDHFGGVPFALVYAPLTLGCSGYFLRTAWLLRRYILYFIVGGDALAEQLGVLAHSYRLVGLLAFWLLVSALCMLLNAATMVSVSVIILNGGKQGANSLEVNLDQLFVLGALMVVSRVAISLTQIFAISHRSVVLEGLFGRQCFSCDGCFGADCCAGRHASRAISPAAVPCDMPGPNARGRSAEIRGRVGNNHVVLLIKHAREGALPQPAACVRTYSERPKSSKKRKSSKKFRRNRSPKSIVRLVTDLDKGCGVPPGNRPSSESDLPSSESDRSSSESDRYTSETITASSDDSPDVLDHTSGGSRPGRPPPGALWLTSSLGPTEAEMVVLDALSDERSDWSERRSIGAEEQKLMSNEE